MLRAELSTRRCGRWVQHPNPARSEERLGARATPFTFLSGDLMPMSSSGADGRLSECLQCPPCCTQSGQCTRLLPVQPRGRCLGLPPRRQAGLSPQVGEAVGLTLHTCSGRRPIRRHRLASPVTVEFGEAGGSVRGAPRGLCLRGPCKQLRPRCLSGGRLYFAVFCCGGRTARETECPLCCFVMK